MLFHFHHLRTDYKNDQKWELEPLRFMELKRIIRKMANSNGKQRFLGFPVLVQP